MFCARYIRVWLTENLLTCQQIICWCLCPVVTQEKFNSMLDIKTSNSHMSIWDAQYVLLCKNLEGHLPLLSCESLKYKRDPDFKASTSVVCLDTLLPTACYKNQQFVPVSFVKMTKITKWIPKQMNSQAAINYKLGISWQAKHAANTVKHYLDRKTHSGTLSVMDWAPQSPDPDIIEAVWDRLGTECNKRCPTSKEQLWMSFKKSGNLFMKTI